MREAGKGSKRVTVIAFFDEMAPLARHSRAQLFQDLWVLFLTNQKRGGYFVEFGASDGVNLSNTYLLETSFGWKGILCEPNPFFWDELKNNRQCIISNKCLYSETGKELELTCTTEGEYSQIRGLEAGDFHTEKRKDHVRAVVGVETISLNDLLDEHNAPDEVDYLSVDTEGSEVQILEPFDFKKRRINLITVEHNYTESRWRLNEILTAADYVHLWPEVSRFDDWYVHKARLDELRNAQG